MNKQVSKPCIIVIDSGFSHESMQGANILAARDLVNDRIFVGSPFLSTSEVELFAGDALNHGSLVLHQIRARMPRVAVILLQVFGVDNHCIRTSWKDGSIFSDGWTEAYLWAVELCEKLGYFSVANCSFGGVEHAADGTGFEAHQLASVPGAGRVGHVVVAAAGTGDGRAVHASWCTEPGDSTWLNVHQFDKTSYNFWFGESHQQWCLNIVRDGEIIASHNGEDIVANFWNYRQQLSVDVTGSGSVSFQFFLPAGTPLALNCEAFVRGENSARFLDHIDGRLVVEPAVFKNVLAVGFRCKSYYPNQLEPGTKPDVLLEGTGEISFRLPEITTSVAQLMFVFPGIDVETIKNLLKI